MSKRHIVFMRSTKKEKLVSASSFVKKAASDISSSKHVKVVKRRIPKNIIDYVENNVGVKFKKRPQFYTYEPTRGHYFKKRKECGGWDGASITGYDINNGKVKETIILLPKSHLKDKRLKENVLTHEVAETLVGQYMIKPNVKRGQTSVNSFEHGFFAMAYEKKHLDKHKMSRQQMTALAKKLFNDRKSWI